MSPRRCQRGLKSQGVGGREGAVDRLQGRDNGPFLRIFMREVTSSHGIESEIGSVLDLGSPLMNQHTRELISARKSSHKHNNKDPSRLR